MNYLSKLLQPICIGGIELKNRVVMPAMATCLATADGFVTDQMISYYARRAEGGVGLMIVEAAYIDTPLGKAIPYELCVDDDKYILGLKQLAQAVHSFGARVALQIHHCGPNTHLEGGMVPVAPSPIPLRHIPDVIPQELSKEDIGRIVRKFALGARRAKQAGFDAVELLCAAGYLLNRFLSPHSNKRQDEYGGNIDGRTRILREIITGIRGEAGTDLPMICKVPGEDYVEGGITINESVAVCKTLEGYGIEALIITGGSSEARFSHIGSAEYPDGHLVKFAEKVKHEVKIPIIAIGKIRNPEFAGKIIGEGKADLVAMGRAHIADPDLVVKSERNRVDRIIPCISCKYCYDRIVYEGKPLRCAINPITGRELELRITPAFRPRKVLVVGGGPAGMQAASTAASRGHKVTICERDSKLGGQLLLAATAPGKQQINELTKYLSGQLNKERVKVKLGVRVTREVVENINPDVVVLATGAFPLIPPITGVELDNVISAWDALANPDKVGDKAIVVGGGLVGCEVANFLAQKGREVTIVEQLESIGLDIGPSIRKSAVQRLLQQGVTMMTKAKATSINRNGITVTKDGKPISLAANTVVLATGSKSNRELLDALESAKVEVHAVGDCLAPRRVVHAISRGFDVGYCL